MKTKTRRSPVVTVILVLLYYLNKMFSTKHKDDRVEEGVLKESRV